MASLTAAVQQDTASHGVETAAVEAVNAAHRRALFKKRGKIHPKRVNGAFRMTKWAMMALTLTIYYVTPWLRWDRGPGAPDQAVLIDFPGRRFYFFFIEIWPQEVYYITGLLILAAVALFLVTSLAGRMWCGYACPQTVWTDLFLVVERAIEGRRNDRIKLDRAPLSVEKVAKRTVKHAIWLLIGVATGGAWVFYFTDAPTLMGQLLTSSAPSEAYFFIALFTATTYTLGGHAREQVCTYMCPWPRIQAAMLDEESLAITYRFDRGEPRGPHKKGDTWDGRGDCIDCRQCVAACPMGIDIRDGLQLECIQCALCIDACNEVMAKVDRPRGLIAYDTDLNIARRQQGLPTRFRFIRPRTVAYALILALVSGVMLFALLKRSDLDVSVIRDRNPTFITLSDGHIRNGYTVKLLNKARSQRTISLTVDGLSGAALTAVGLPTADDGSLQVPVEGDDLRPVRVFITLPHELVVHDSMPLSIVARDEAAARPIKVQSVFLGPKP
ncbi:MAG: cytochrome c oxidase accessory protein CcoG [Rhodospirillaceae bacterium]|nr:cytochrome c oxidase accessory protein CcoG [Rhodospirillaceae bacterium]